MSLGCANCGSCCNPVRLDVENRDGMDQWRRYLDAGGDELPTPGTDAEFVMEHLTEIARNDNGATYSCDRYDPVHSRCTAHEDRPKMCRDFPWYNGSDPDTLRKDAPILYRSCSYLLDVPPVDRGPDARPLIPISIKE